MKRMVLKQTGGSTGQTGGGTLQGNMITRLTDTKVVIATTVALSFISFWRAASIVLCDFASSAYYAGGIAEHAVGKAAPWFVLGVMVFAFAVRAVYMESCSMFVRGGVYVVVKQALGKGLALFAVSALLFDFVLTGPISAVVAGQYLTGLANEPLKTYYHTQLSQEMQNWISVALSVLVTAYFWNKNKKGMHESSTTALRIMQVTTGMVLIFLVWCAYTLVHSGIQTMPPPPTLAHLHFGADGLGWLQGTIIPTLWLPAVLIATGHSILSMSGFETLAQIYREVEKPKLRNLKRTANLVCGYGVVITGIVTVMVAMVVPSAVHNTEDYINNQLGVGVQFFAGPYMAKVIFRAVVVTIGSLILYGAVNTSIIGANGVLNRLGEDNVLPAWLRRTHPKYETTSLMISIIAGLQIFTLLASQGDVTKLGEAYAFGVVWSFAMTSLAVLAIRFQTKKETGQAITESSTQAKDEEYHVPLNWKLRRPVHFTLGKRVWLVTEIPFGLALIAGILFTLAIANLFTKTTATKWGIGFTAILCVFFTVSDWLNNKKSRREDAQLEQFRIVPSDTFALDFPRAERICLLKPGGSLMPLVRALADQQHNEPGTDQRGCKVLVLYLRPHLGINTEVLPESIFDRDARVLFTNVVNQAERLGTTVRLAMVPTGSPGLEGVTEVIQALQPTDVYMGASETRSTDAQAESFGHILDPIGLKYSVHVHIVSPDGAVKIASMGVHDVACTKINGVLAHDIWLDATSSPEYPPGTLHHHQVITAALNEFRRLQKEDPASFWVALQAVMHPYSNQINSN